MATHARTSGPATFTVEVSGSWLDPRTLLEAPRTETFRVLARHPGAAETAGLQLYGSAAAAQACVATGRRFARAT
jgi:hypothetical protein